MPKTTQSKSKPAANTSKSKYSKKPQTHRVCAVLPPNVSEEDVAWSTGQMEQLLSIHRGGFSSRRLLKIMNEFINGYKFIRHYKKAVSIFGSARTTMKAKVYRDAEKLGYDLAREGFAVITGGGPGIMEAANQGALRFGGESVGLNIQLPEEQRINPYVNESTSFHYFFTRKVMLASVSQVYVFYPGGFGTMDELFEMLTLIQTKKVAPIKVIMVGAAFWGPLMHWVKETVYKQNRTISKEDLGFFNVVDNAHEAMLLIREMVKKKHIAQLSREQDTLEHQRAGVVMKNKSKIKTDTKPKKKRQPHSYF